MKRFVYEYKREIAAFVLLGIITVLLCIPYTLNFGVKIFGWAVYFYLFIAYCAAILHCLKKSINLTAKSIVWLVLSVFCAIATIHIACADKTTAVGFTDYIVGAYTSGTAGGVIFAVLTSPFVVWCTYVWAIVIFMVATVVFSFLFIRPFVFEGTNSPFEVKPKKRKPSTTPEYHEIILDESPFLHKKTASAKPVPFMTEKKQDDKEDAYSLLFGNVSDMATATKPSIDLSNDESYLVHRYDLRQPLVKATEKMNEEQAVDLLFGKEEGQQTSEILNFGDDEKDAEIIFDDEKDERICDILQAQPIEGSLIQALRQNANECYAPSPIIYAGMEEKETEDDEDDIDILESMQNTVTEEKPEEEEEKILPPQKKETPEQSIPVSPKYVYYNGQLVPVIDGTTPVATASPAPAVQAAQTGAATIYNDEPPQEPSSTSPAYHKIVQLSTRPNLPYNKPPISILQNHITANFNPQVDNWDELREIFEVKLKNFNIDAKLVDATKGPTVTLCALELGDKCPIAKLISIKADLQRWLKSTKPIAIIQQIPGTDYCGVQIPNEVKGVVSFKEIISSKEYREAKGDILIALGKTAEGEIMIEDLAAMPHALVAGETGSGKSVCLNVVLASILFRYSPEEVQLLLIDLKEVEMALYAGLPHMLLKEPLSSIPSIVNALKWIREEVVNRFALFKSLHLRNLTEYNKQEGVKKLPRIVIIIDEASELMTDPNARKTLESTLSSLARISRAAGVHLIFATQNPVKTVITNEIQNNLNTKIAFAVGDYNHSMVIFKSKGAECLLGRGDMYIKRGQEMRRAQCAFVDTPEIEEAVQYIRDNNEVEFDDNMIEKILNGNMTENDKQDAVTPGQQTMSGIGTNTRAAQDDETEDGANAPDLNWQALKLIVDSNYVSCSFLQRKLKKGYNTIANVLEELSAEGYLSSVPQGSKDKRDILISRDDFYREWKLRFGQTADVDYDLENFDKSNKDDDYI